jgi:hypothetical protein
MSYLSTGSIKLNCKSCGKIYHTFPYLIHRHKYCSYRCRNHGQEGTRKTKCDRRIKRMGYIMLRINNKYVWEHRLIVERELKIKLKKNQIVHHLNHNRTDNRIENLQVLTRRQHNHIHCVPAMIASRSR